MTTVPIIDHKVKVTLSKGKLLVDPEDALILLGDGISWEVSGLREIDTIEIDFHIYDDWKGPFPRSAKLLKAHSVRGRYTLQGPGKIEAAPSDRSGYWKYSIVVRDPESRDIAIVDPGVMIKKKGG